MDNKMDDRPFACNLKLGPDGKLKSNFEWLWAAVIAESCIACPEFQSTKTLQLVFLGNGRIGS